MSTNRNEDRTGPEVDDVEGHRLYQIEGDEEDVEGHVQPRRDTDIER